MTSAGGARSDRPGGGLIPHSHSSDTSASYHHDRGSMDGLPIGRANSMEEDEYIR